MAAFAQFASDLDAVTRKQLERGARLVELLKQGQYQPLSVERQVIALFAGTKGYLDDLPVDKIATYEKDLIAFIEGKHPQILEDIKTKKAIDKDIESALVNALEAFGKGFGKGDGKSDEPEPPKEEPKKKKKKAKDESKDEAAE
jgi:F-type H+-transporting ATPase subunit alpha